MKKIVSLVLVPVMVLSLSTTVFAADNTFDPGNTAGKSTTVTFQVAPTYTVTIPATITLTKDEDTGNYKQDATIAAENVRLKEGETIKVALDSDFKLTTGDSGTTYELPYTITVGDSQTAITTDATVATFGTSTTEQTSTLHFAAENPKYAGDYSDTVTFTISVNGPVNN